MSTDTSFHDFVAAVSDDDDQTDLDHISDEEMAAAANESDSASDTEAESTAAAAVDVKPPPKKIAKTASSSKSKPAESKTPKKRKAPDSEKKSSAKKSDKAAAAVVVKKPEPSPKSSKSSSKPASAQPVVAQFKKGTKLPVCTSLVEFKVRSVHGRDTTVTGRGASAVASCFRAVLLQFNAMSTLGKRVIVESFHCTLRGDDGLKLVELMRMISVDHSVTLDVVFRSAWEMFRGQYQCDPLFVQDEAASA